jgi:hypothetical protein
MTTMRFLCLRMMPKAGPTLGHLKISVHSYLPFFLDRTSPPFYRHIDLLRDEDDEQPRRGAAEG